MKRCLTSVLALFTCVACGSLVGESFEDRGSTERDPSKEPSAFEPNGGGEDASTPDPERWQATAPQCGEGPCRVRDVSVHDRMACVITQLGELRCREQNTRRPAPLPKGTFRSVSVGAMYGGCAIAEDGMLHCWAESEHSTVDLNTPTVPVTAVAVGFYLCALADGAILCWGKNGPANGGEVPKFRGRRWLEVASGIKICGIRSEDQGVECASGWGPPIPHGRGLVGGDNGAFCALDSASSKPVCWYDDVKRLAVPDEPMTSLAIGHSGSTACGIVESGALRCWATKLPEPTAPPPASDVIAAVPKGTFRKVAIGEGFACAIGSDDALVCWGRKGSVPTSFGVL